MPLCSKFSLVILKRDSSAFEYHTQTMKCCFKLTRSTSEWIAFLVQGVLCSFIFKFGKKKLNVSSKLFSIKSSFFQSFCPSIAIGKRFSEVLKKNKRSVNENASLEVIIVESNLVNFPPLHCYIHSNFIPPLYGVTSVNRTELKIRY